jgi:iron complex transport system substrate-binding protein
MRRLGLIMLVVVTFAAAACGRDDGNGDAAQATIMPASTTGTAHPAAAACREVQHELGTACIPASPQRIVTLDPLTALPTLLDLGAPVVGSTSVYAAGTLFPQYIEPNKVQGITTLGTSRQPDLEKVALARPDLIVGWAHVIQPVQAQLEAIAPTVATNYSFYNSGWRDDVLFIADLVGKREEVAGQLAELDRRSAALRPRLTVEGRPLQLSRVDVFQGQALYYRFACTWFGEVLARAGVEQPAAQQGQCTNNDSSSVFVYVSNEQFQVLDGDAIVTYVQPQSAADAAADPLTVLAQNPLWGGLKAARNGRAFAFGDAWGLGASVRAANVILDDLETKVAR